MRGVPGPGTEPASPMLTGRSVTPERAGGPEHAVSQRSLSTPSRVQSKASLRLSRFAPSPAFKGTLCLVNTLLLSLGDSAIPSLVVCDSRLPLNLFFGAGGGGKQGGEHLYSLRTEMSSALQACYGLVLFL